MSSFEASARESQGIQHGVGKICKYLPWLGLRVGFAVLKWPYLQKAYLVTNAIILILAVVVPNLQKIYKRNSIVITLSRNNK